MSSGLGLAVVKRIASLLGLNVQLVSAPGEGSTFKVFFPKTQPTTTAESKPANERAVTETAPAFSGLAVLVVDDNPDIVEALGGLIETWSCTALGASSYQQTCELVHKTGSPDFAIIDDMLDRQKSGLEVAIWLADNMPKDRIIIVTGNVQAQRRREIEQSGFKVYQKPIKAAQLYDLVAQTAAQADTIED